MTRDDSLLLVVGGLGAIGLATAITLLAGCAAGQIVEQDAKVCAKSEVATAVASATTQFLTAAALSNGATDTYLQIGTSLALKYGADVAWCTIQKAWADLGGVAFMQAHLQPSKELVAADYLRKHPDMWLRK